MANVQETKGGVGGVLANAPMFVQQVKAETKKVAWPTRRETLMTTLMVVIMTSVLGLFFFGVDRAFGAIVKALLGLLA